MKANRKQRQKRNIFSDDDSDESEKQAEKGNASEVKQEKNDIYDPAKMKQNEMYINKKQADHTVFAFDVDGEQNSQDEKPIEKSKKQRKKKNLFDDSEEEQSNQEGENTHLQLQKTNNPLKQKKKQKSESNSQTQSEESPQRIEKVQGMINQEKEKQKQINQQSFQILINEKGKSLEERKKLFSKPLEKGYQAVCYFKRIVSGFSQTYQLLGEDERPLIFCQNQRGSIGANYYFSLTKEMDKTSSSYLGKLRGNASGSQYQLYNDGKQPGKHLDRSQWRTSLAYIEYESNFMGMNGPRKFKVSLPNFGEYDEDSYKLAENENLTAFQPPIIKQMMDLKKGIIEINSRGGMKG